LVKKPMYEEWGGGEKKRRYIHQKNPSRGAEGTRNPADQTGGRGRTCQGGKRRSETQKRKTEIRKIRESIDQKRLRPTNSPRTARATPRGNERRDWVVGYRQLLSKKDRKVGGKEKEPAPTNEWPIRPVTRGGGNPKKNGGFPGVKRKKSVLGESYPPESRPGTNGSVYVQEKNFVTTGGGDGGEKER